MTKQEMNDMEIENLILRLNNMALERMAILDTLWNLENDGEKLRVELLKQMKNKRYYADK